MKQCLFALAIALVGANAAAVTYTYDSLNRVTSATYGTAGTIFYAYDATGNLLSQTPFTGPAAAPGVSTAAATGIGAQSATLNGTVNANGSATTVTFDHGLTESYGTRAAATPATVEGATGSTVSLALTGLTCNTLYHFRVNGVNSAGTASGPDRTFTTAACPVMLPNAPVLNTIAIGPRSVTLYFTPAVSGGMATAYTASCVATGSGPFTTSGAASPLTVYGLASGLAYACTVTASNSAGGSAASAALNAVPVNGGNVAPILMFLLD